MTRRIDHRHQPHSRAAVAAMRKAALLATAAMPLVACGTSFGSGPALPPGYGPPENSAVQSSAAPMPLAPAALPEPPPPQAGEQGTDYVETGLQLLPLLNLVPAKRAMSSQPVPPAPPRPAPVPDLPARTSAVEGEARAAAAAAERRMGAARGLMRVRLIAARLFGRAAGRSAIAAGTAAAVEGIEGVEGGAIAARLIFRLLFIPVGALLLLLGFGFLLD